VLRRAQAPADRSHAVQVALDSLDRDAAGVRLSSVRLLPANAVLIPVQRIAPKGPEGTTPPDDRRFDSVCLYSPASDGTGGSACFSAGDISGGMAIGGQGDVIDGLVPDGVAEIRLTAHSVVIDAPVHDNYFRAAFPATARLRPDFPLVAVERAVWLDEDGNALKMIDYTQAARRSKEAVPPGTHVIHTPPAKGLTGP
jgi:hypothetical protein